MKAKKWSHIPVPVDEVEYLIKQDEDRRLCHSEEVPENARVPRRVRTWRWGQGRLRPSSPAICRAMSIQGVFGPVAGIPGVANEGYATLTSSGTVAPVCLEQVLNSSQAG